MVDLTQIILKQYLDLSRLTLAVFITFVFLEQLFHLFTSVYIY